MRKELLKGLTEEQIARVKACKNNEELLAIAKEEGIELTDEQLEAVSGGSVCGTTVKACPRCQSVNFRKLGTDGNGSIVIYRCNDCNCKFDDRGDDVRIIE